MKSSKLLTGLALVCSMGSAMALTSTVTGVTGTSRYTFEDGTTTNPIATLTLTSERLGGSGAKFTRAELTYSAAPTAPVPEPETYAMLLAGLGLMGAIARRRKSK